MSQGRSHPDDPPEDEATEAMPRGGADEGTHVENTMPPLSYAAEGNPARADSQPPPTIPSQRLGDPDTMGGTDQTSPPTIPSQRALTGEAPSDDSIGIHGPLQPGQVLFHRYRAEKMLGEGGMGTVWLVTHLELDTLRALKLIVSGIAFDPNAQARFKREARVMARLSHPNAVVVHDAMMARDAAFIEMEYIRGLSLNRRISAGVPMPLDWTARILEQLCDVLDEAHRQKIVHRDLKPANLMLLDGRPVGREQLKVLDFGIAKILESETAAGDIHTNTGNFLGSAPYTSPEQASGSQVDARSDLYSVGIILYELLTGHRPFGGPITRMIYDHLYTPPPPFATRNASAGVPPEIERVVLRCLAKHPTDRPQSAQQLCDEFLRALPDSVRSAVPPPSSSPSELPRTELDPLDRDAPAPRTERLPWGGPPVDDPGVSTEHGTRGMEFAPGPPPPDQRTQGIAPAPAIAAASDWDLPPLPPGKLDPSASRRRTWIVRAAAVAVLVLVAAVALAVVVSARRRPVMPAGPPAGYVAGEGAAVVAGVPAVLVRKADGTKFVRIDGGRFMMGNSFDKTARDDDEDQPAHPVALTGFYMQETEVTNAEMKAYFIANRVDVADRPRRWDAAVKRIVEAGHDPAKYPAVGISHDLAERFARWAGGALSTEAQWEFAARSRGKDIPYVWGASPPPDTKSANVDSVGLIGSVPTAQVGAYPRDRTEQGVFDLTGNVREWCRDRWAPYAGSTDVVRDPTGPPGSKEAAAEFVIRGGSWAFWKDKTRTTRPRRPEPSDLTAENLAQDSSADDLGFRIVLEWPSAREDAGPHP